MSNSAQAVKDKLRNISKEKNVFIFALNMVEKFSIIDIIFM